MIDERTLEQARNADLIAFLEKQYGFTFAHQGGVFRCQQHNSLAIKSDRRSWYWHSKGIGGYGALDFLMIGESMPFRHAVETITGIAPPTAPPRREAEPPKTLILPEKAGIPLRLYDYLCKRRGIDGDIVSTLINRDKIYEDKRGNVVFVGYDEYLKPRFASLRGTQGDCPFRGDCSGSDKRYSFSISGFSERLYIFESPIDAMSHASIVKADTGAWEQDSRLSLAGTSDTAIPFFLNQHRSIKELVFCLDNDAAGREATATMAQKYAYKGYTALNEPPRGKDYNEDLQALTAQKRAVKRTKPLHRDVDI
jgi:hypothetical protein